MSFKYEHNKQVKLENTKSKLVGWLVGWLVSGAPTFVIWHHSLIHSCDLAPLINYELILILVSSAKVKAFYGIANKVN